MARSIKSGESDWLKYYCIVFGILILVVGFMYFKINGDLEEYRTANKRAQNLLLNPEQIERRDGGGVPITIPGLALDVKKYVDAYDDAVGGEGGSGISSTLVKAAATKAGLVQESSNKEQVTADRAGGFETIHMSFRFGASRLENLVKFLYNIEQRRYRAYEVRWTLADGQNPDQGQMNRIGKFTVKIGMRKPLSSER